MDELDRAATEFIGGLESYGIELPVFLEYRERLDNLDQEVIARIYRIADAKDKK